MLAAIKADMLPGTGPGCGDSPASRAALERALARWRVRLPVLPDDAGIAGACRDGIRLICPGDAEWPGALDQLGPARPYALPPPAPRPRSCRSCRAATGTAAVAANRR